MTELSAVDRLVSAHHALSDAYRLEPSPPYARRREWLDALCHGLLKRAQELAQACNEDLGGCSLRGAMLDEVWLAGNELKALKNGLRRWMRPEPACVPLGLPRARARVLSQPKGVVGIIGPANHPVICSLRPLGAALAAGNRVIFKLSEKTPRTSALVGELVERAVPRDVVRVFSGGPAEGEALSGLALDYLMFSGSQRAAARVYARAAKNLVPVSLELGGKCPALLHPSFSIGRFADKVLQAKCFGGGRSDIAPDYLLVPEAMISSVVAAFRELFAARFSQLGNNLDGTPGATDGQHQRLQGVLHDAISRGAEAVVLTPADQDLLDRRKVPLTLLLGVPEDARVHEEETLGPLLPVIPYRNLDQAIDYINARPRPIAFDYFDEDRTRAEDVLRRTPSGRASVHDTLSHLVRELLLRSAKGAAGMGACQAKAGFDLFSDKKSVGYQAALNGAGLFKPPHGQARKRVRRLRLRRSRT